MNYCPFLIPLDFGLCYGVGTFLLAQTVSEPNRGHPEISTKMDPCRIMSNSEEIVRPQHPRGKQDIVEECVW